MFGQPPSPIAEQHRTIMREVALTYRREKRAAHAEGAKPPEQYQRAYEAAHAKYRELDPEALCRGCRQGADKGGVGMSNSLS